MNPSPSNNRPKRKSGVIVPHSPRWHQRIAAWLVVTALKTIAATIRYRLDDKPGFYAAKPPGTVIYCLWHNRLALCADVYWRFAKQVNPTKGVAALVSASKDGAFLSAILEGFRIQAVRGSSSRRGPQALLELTGWAENDYDLAITPDGPRGPCYTIQEGVMALAQLTGMPIIPVALNLSWKVQLGSWDRFQIPLPFSRCDIIVGQPVRIPRECSDADRESLRRNLEESLRAITKD